MSKRFPGRRLSPLRVTAVLVGAGLLTAAGASGVKTLEDSRAAEGSPWFAGYVDATATPRFEFETPTSKSARDIVLSFIVAGNGPDESCTPTWGTAYTLDSARAGLDLDRRIERLRQGNGSVVVSFGGALNRELAAACTDPAALEKAYLAVIERYDVATIDLDLEGDGLADRAANQRRASVLAAIQKKRKAEGNPLAVWLTLPVATTGLTEIGTQAVADTLASPLKVAGTNLMTMDFGGSRKRQQLMADASISALNASHRQLKILYRQAGQPIGTATTWKRMGATPMLGQNDVRGEIFTLADARKLNAFAIEKGLGRTSVWSLNRDRSCGSNYTAVETVSDACSGIAQGSTSFARVLGRGHTGLPDTGEAAPTVTEAPAATAVVDDPKTSPYAIWNAGNAYLLGTKVVWKRNVYISKWWTRGDQPDNPVLQEHETPWTLVGPVLEGETPIVPPKIAAFAYPRWKSASVYQRGDRVLFEGVAFEAKWWTQRDNPMAGTAGPDASPWSRLTDAQVRAANAERAK